MAIRFSGYFDKQLLVMKSLTYLYFIVFILCTFKWKILAFSSFVRILLKDLLKLKKRRSLSDFPSTSLRISQKK